MVDGHAWLGHRSCGMAKARRIRRASAHPHQRHLDHRFACQRQDAGDRTADGSKELEAAEPKRWIKVSAPLSASPALSNAWAALRGLKPRLTQ